MLWRDFMSGELIAVISIYKEPIMPQEVSISYQAVKSKVYKLIDAMVEGEKSPVEVQESMQRWWALVHPADRLVAQKYLITVLEKSHAALASILLGSPDIKPSKPTRMDESGKLLKPPVRSERPAASAF